MATLGKQVAAFEAGHGVAVENDLREEAPIPLPVKEAILVFFPGAGPG